MQYKTLFWYRAVQFSLFSIIVLGGIFEQKSWAIVSLFFFTPLLITLFRNTDYYSIELTTRSKYISYPLIILNIIISFILTTGYDFIPNEDFYSFSFSIGQFTAFILILLIIVLKGDKFNGTSKTYLVYIIMTLTINNFLIFINYPTKKLAYKHYQIIKNKSIHN